MPSEGFWRSQMSDSKKKQDDKKKSDDSLLNAMLFDAIIQDASTPSYDSSSDSGSSGE